MEALVRNVLGPLVRRIGTAAAVYLVADGYDSGTVEQVINAAGAFVLVLVDLLLSRFYRRSVVETAVSRQYPDIS